MKAKGHSFSSALVDISTRPPKLSSGMLIRMVMDGILEANRGSIVMPMLPYTTREWYLK